MQNPGEKYVGREREGVEGGGGARAAGATAATQAEPGRELVMQRGGAATWAIPQEDHSMLQRPCSHQVPHRTEGLRTQGHYSSRTRMRKSPPPLLHLISAAQDADPRMKGNPPQVLLTPCYPKGAVPRPAASASPGGLPAMQSLRPHLCPSEAKPAFS